MILFVEKRVFVDKHGFCLVPTNTGSALIVAEKLPMDKDLRADVTQPRNLDHHKKYWALCSVVAEATDVTSDEISDILKFRTGHYVLEAIEADDGKWQTVARLKSIAFHRFDQLAFNEFFERCVRIIYERWYGTVGHNSGKYLKEKIDEMLAPTTEKRS